MKVGGKTYRYEYDGNGQRTRKSNEDGGYTEYYLIDGLAVAERRYYAGGSERYTMRYLYDESNSPVGLGLKYPGESLWTYFYFEKNVQGDVIGLYRSDYSSSRGYYGTLVARYSYDPYGRPVSMTNASGTTISQTAYNVAAYNPFRYRGYRYDGETGLYYLQSRYYDPETCRFINADSYAGTGQGITGYNMFSYCNSNPICQIDVSGNAARPVTMLVNDGGSRGGAVGSVSALEELNEQRDQGTFDFQYQEYIEDNYYFYVTTEEIDKEFSLTESVLTNPWLSYFVSTGISNIPVVGPGAGMLFGATSAAVSCMPNIAPGHYKVFQLVVKDGEQSVTYDQYVQTTSFFTVVRWFCTLEAPGRYHCELKTVEYYSTTQTEVIWYG